MIARRVCTPRRCRTAAAGLRNTWIVARVVSRKEWHREIRVGRERRDTRRARNQERQRLRPRRPFYAHSLPLSLFVSSHALISGVAWCGRVNVAVCQTLLMFRSHISRRSRFFSAFSYFARCMQLTPLIKIWAFDKNKRRDANRFHFTYFTSKNAYARNCIDWRRGHHAGYGGGREHRDVKMFYWPAH